MSLVFVGAMNVGSIKLNFDDVYFIIAKIKFFIRNSSQIKN